jgi:hypothetical protein
MTLDTLEILIEANATGLQSQLLRAKDTITNFVSSMNKQEVNWQSILAKTISPAIISGVASTFASALTNMLQFQNTVAQTTQTTGDTFSINSDKITKESKGLAKEWGVSANDITEAAGYISKSFSDVSTQSVILRKSSAIASTGLMDVQDAAKLLTDMMVAWNISTAPEAASAIDRIWQSANNSKLSFSEFADVIISSGQKMSGITSIDEMSAAIEVFSNQSGVTKDNVKNMFEVIAESAANTATGLNGLLGGKGSVVNEIKENGLGALITTISERVSELGSNGVIVMENFGVKADLTKVLQRNVNEFQNLQTAIDKIASTPPLELEVKIKGDWSTIQELKSIFEKIKWFITDFIEDIAGRLGEFYGKITSGNGAIESMNTGKGGLLRDLGIISDSSSNASSADSSKNTNTYFQNTYNITSEKGTENINAQNIANQQYLQFQGVK